MCVQQKTVSELAVKKSTQIKTMKRGLNNFLNMSLCAMDGGSSGNQILPFFSSFFPYRQAIFKRQLYATNGAISVAKTHGQL